MLLNISVHVTLTRNLHEYYGYYFAEINTQELVG